MLTAFVDESLRRRPHDDSIYAMAGVIIDGSHHDKIRITLEDLRRGKSPRLHWRDETPARQRLIATTLAELPIAGIVTVHIYSGGHRTERARRRCLERLLIEVDQAGAAKVVIESRSSEQDQLDRGLLTGLRKATVVPKSLAVTWQPSISEPLLWAADAVVSATTWWIDGVPTFYDLLSLKISTICVD